MHARGIAWTNPGAHAIDNLEASRLVLKHAQLEIGRVSVIGKAHRVPFDVKLPVRRGAGNQGEDAAPVGPRRATAQTDVRLEVMPERKNREVMCSPRQADRTKGRISGHKLRVAVRGQIDAGVAVPIQREREWQNNRRYAVVAVVTGVGYTRHDGIGP